MSDSKALRVAFYGGMANNCYMACSQLRELGLNATFIRDHLDNYAISQPLWEDMPFQTTFNDIQNVRVCVL